MENKITEFYEKIKDYKYVVLIDEPNHTVFGKVLSITLEENYRKNLSISFEVVDTLIIKEDNINEKNIKSIPEELFLTYREELHKTFDKIEF